VKSAWAFSCIVALSVILGGCGKGGSQNGTEASAASAVSASEAPAQPASGASDTPAASGAQKTGMLGTVTKAQLPAESAETLRLIKAGGPFPFGEDGVLFRNSAGLLPAHRHLASDYLTAALNSGFAVRGCAEPRWPASDQAGGPLARRWCGPAADAAYTGTPAAIVWHFQRP